EQSTRPDSMNSTRSFLFFAVLLSGFLLWQAWQQDYAAKPASAPTATATATPTAPVPGDEVPKATTAPATPTAPAPASSAATEAAPAQRIDVSTDVLHVVIDSRGASVVEADLLAYPIEPDDKTRPVRLLADTSDRYFVVQSGLVSATAPAPDHR